jgi:hypothetical protein
MPGFAREDVVYFTGAGDTDALMRMMLELASEMWVLRDRLTVIEHTLAGQGTDLSAVDQPVTDPELARLLAEQRSLLTERLMAAAGAAPRGSVQP